MALKLLKQKALRSTSKYITSSSFGVYKCDFKKLSNEIYQEEMKRMETAAKHVRLKILEKIKSLNIGKLSGDLLKGIRYKRLSNSYIVGAMAPAWHAHFIELGTIARKVLNYKGKKGVVVSVGSVKPKPFIGPTFAEEKEKVRQIMSEPIL